MFFLSLLFCFFLKVDAQVTTFNIRDFGAIPNDNKDDTKAIQNCIDASLKAKKSKVVIPFGKYNISKQLIFDYLYNEITFHGELRGSQVPTIYSTSSDNIILVKGFLFDPSQGIFNMENINLYGSNPVYSNVHPNINNTKWNAALAVWDKSRVSINNVSINNFYGQGIHVSTTKQEDISVASCFDFVRISNCKVRDVWGSNPKRDDYGDGIYLSNISSGILENNYIYNNINKTKQLGRAGIVLEYMTENINVLNNTVEGGYDRAIHIEKTFGGHIIKGNIFKGSDLGLVVAEFGDSNYEKTEISNNLFSNENLFKNIPKIKSYAANSYGDRALAVIITDAKLPASKILIVNNKFIINQNYEYNSNSILNNRSNSVIVQKNQFITKNGNSKYSIFNYGGTPFLDNKVQSQIDIKK